MDLKEYLINQHQQTANVDESLILGLLCGGLFGGIFGGIMGMFSKKQKAEYDEDSGYNKRRRDDDDDEDAEKKGKKDKDKEGEEEKTDTPNELGANKPINKMSPEEQEKWMLKTQFLMQREIDNDLDSDESKRAIALMNQVNACMYDENGKLRSPEDREKFCKENIDPDASFDDIMADYKKAADKAAFKQPNDLNSMINFDGVTDENIEDQRNKSKESAKSTLTTLARQKEADPEGDPYMNLMAACGYSEADRKEAKKRIDTKRAMQKAEADKAETMAAFEQKKADITKDPSLSEDEKTDKIKEAETEKNNKIKEIDDNLKKTIKDLGGDATTTTGGGEPKTTTTGGGEPKTTTTGGGEPKKLSDDEIEQLQKDLDSAEEGSDEYKAIETKLKKAAKDKGKSEDEYIPKVQTGADGKQYKFSVGPRGGHKYKVKGEDGKWSQNWNSYNPKDHGHPWENDKSFMDFSSYIKMIFS